MSVAEVLAGQGSARVTMPARGLLAALPDGAAGLVVTDPPWDLAGGGRFAECASYPRLGVEEVASVLGDARRVLVPGGHLYLFAPAGVELFGIMQAFAAQGWHFLRALAWDKGVDRGLGAYRNGWEPCLIWSNGKSRGFDGPHQSFSSLLKAPHAHARTAKPWGLYKVFLEMSSQPGAGGVEFRPAWRFKGPAVKHILEMLDGAPRPWYNVCCGAARIPGEDARVDLYHPSAHHAQMDFPAPPVLLCKYVRSKDPPSARRRRAEKAREVRP